MEEKKYLKVIGKKINPDGSSCQAETTVPFEKGNTVALPDVPPFNDNIVLHSDDGFNMKWIEFTQDGKVGFFYSDYYEFVDGKIHAEKTYWCRKYIFDFELIDQF